MAHGFDRLALAKAALSARHNGKAFEGHSAPQIPPASVFVSPIFTAHLRHTSARKRGLISRKG